MIFVVTGKKNNETNNKDKKKEVATCPPSLVLALTVPYLSNQAMSIAGNLVLTTGLKT